MRIFLLLLCVLCAEPVHGVSDGACPRKGNGLTCQLRNSLDIDEQIPFGFDLGPSMMGGYRSVYLRCLCSQIRTREVNQIVICF